MLSVAIILFRESLEAALFIGILTAALAGVSNRRSLITWGVIGGVLGAIGLAVLSEPIANSFDGLGADLLNIGILVLAIGMLIWHCIFGVQHGQEMSAQAKSLGLGLAFSETQERAISIAVALTVLREGAESVLFLMGFSSQVSWGETFLGASLGISMGVLVGVMTFKGLHKIPMKQMMRVTNVLIAFFAAGLASQLAKNLHQAGAPILENNLWDISKILSNDSALGRLLHILIGYDAHPSGLQFVLYLGVLALIYLGMNFNQLFIKRHIIA